ncbi:hypothetical protein [Brevundimonas sp.]|uniref:hypothetical protein n=1 Tax=Brevundimonas sp. TaxID=1871086 RepID=UPI0025C3751F|nr:hypothetical protein [Brevundimonas sp.]
MSIRKHLSSYFMRSARPLRLPNCSVRICIRRWFYLLVLAWPRQHVLGLWSHDSDRSWSERHLVADLVHGGLMLGSWLSTAGYAPGVVPDATTTTIIDALNGLTPTIAAIACAVLLSGYRLSHARHEHLTGMLQTA